MLEIPELYEDLLTLVVCLPMILEHESLRRLASQKWYILFSLRVNALTGYEPGQLLLACNILTRAQKLQI